ncbi:MAG TPA: TonB-dependent receptor [Candidatus Acidoferrales bacterium]|nr:TonB-dependent receptor [Candidatus Acidoferrales bacterium]
MRLCKSVVLLVGVLVAIGTFSSAFGQGVTGQILGTVEDQSKAVIPGATVTVTNEANGYQASVPTSATGDYVVPALPPGGYKVTVDARGFQQAVSNNVVVTVNGTSRVDFTMQIGASTQTVEVQATAPLVDSTNATMGNDLSTRQVESIPLYGRVYSQLIDLMPGAVKTGIGSSSESGTGIGANGSITASVNGMPYQGTTYTLDGVSDMELENAFQNITPPVDSIQEVKVSGNNAGADVGVYGGAQVNAVIKSGTNQIHGTAYEYYRSVGLNANSWYAGFNHAPKASFRSNQYGVSLGGPIKRDKLFYFGDFQGLQFDQGHQYVYSVPTTLERGGYFPINYFPKGIYDPQSPGTAFPTVTLAAGTGGCVASPANTNTPSCTVQCIPNGTNACSSGSGSDRWDTVAAKVLADNTIFPAAQTEAAQNNFIENVTSTNPQYQFDAKIDYNLRGQDHLFGRLSYARNDLSTPGPTKFLNVGEDANPREHNDVFGYTHWFSPNVLNEFRFGFDRFYTFHHGNDYGINEDATLGIPNGNISQFPFTSGVASLSFGGDQSAGSWPGTGHPGYSNSIRRTNTYEITDNITHIRGKHTFGYGVDYRRLQATVTNADHSQAGSFSFDQSYTSSCAGNPSCSATGGSGAGIADFMLGLPTSLNRDIVNAYPSTRLTIADVYFQDQFRVTRALTLIYGLRWDLITQYNDANNHQSNLNINTGYLDVATPENRGPNVYTPFHNFGPRLGIAYTPDAGKTAIRAGWSMTHFPDHYGAAGGTLERNWPWFEEYVLGQQAPNTPWAAISSTLNMPTGACPLGTATQIPTCFIGLPGFVPQAVTNTVTPSPSSSLYYVPYNNQPDTESMWNVGVQRELTPTSSIDIAYVGTKGTNLFRSININQAFPGPEQIYMNLPCSGSTLTTPTVPSTLYSGLKCANGIEIANSLQANRVYATLGCTQFDATATLAAYNPVTGVESAGSQPVCDQGPLAQIQSINERGSTGYSNYNALQVKYTKRISRGLEALLSYTWSKEIDDMTVFVPLVNQDQYNRALGNASAPDVPHLFIGSFVYDLPFGKGRDFLSSSSYPVDLLFGGWQLSGVTTIQHGVPLAVGNGLSNNGGLNGGFGNRANYDRSTCGNHAGIVNQINTGSSTQGQLWFNLSCFSNPAEVAAGPTGVKVAPYGTSVPGNVWGPGLVNFDFSLTKSVPLGESRELQLQVSAFNAMNTPHFSNPNTTCCTANNAGFGVITGTSNPNRQLQLGLHFQF